MTTDKVISVRFKYDDVVRHVDNIKFEDEVKMFVGVEVRKGGRFSNKIKRFDMSKMDKLEFITLDRVRP